MSTAPSRGQGPAWASSPPPCRAAPPGLPETAHCTGGPAWLAHAPRVPGTRSFPHHRSHAPSVTPWPTGLVLGPGVRRGHTGVSGRLPEGSSQATHGYQGTSGRKWHLPENPSGTGAPSAAPGGSRSRTRHVLFAHTKKNQGRSLARSTRVRTRLGVHWPFFTLAPASAPPPPPAIGSCETRVVMARPYWLEPLSSSV